MRPTRVVLLVAAAALAAWAAGTLVADEAATGPDRDARTAAVSASVPTADVGSPESPSFSGRSSEPLPTPATAAPVESLHQAALSPAATGITVRTLDARGTALSGIYVSASVLPIEDTTVEARTGPDGSAWLECPAGSYRVYASDLSPESRLGSAGQDDVKVAPGESREVTLTLPDATSRLEVLVRDSSGRLLEDVKLDANGPGPQWVETERFTNASGLAVWEPVAAGRWSVRIEDFPSTLGVIKPQDSSLRLEVEAGLTARGEFVCPQMGRLTARLEHESLAAELVRVTAQAERTEEEKQVKAGVPPEGFTWLLPPGSYVLSAEWRPDSSRWSRPQLVEVASAQETIATIEAFDCQTHLMGHVRDEAGQPVRGVVVGAEISDPPGGRAWTNRKLSLLAKKSAKSGEDGSWTIAVPVGRKGELTVNTTPATGRYLARYEGRLEIVDYSRPVELVVEPGCGVKVEVEGEKAAALAEDNRVRLYVVREGERQPGPSQRSAHRENDGSFQFKYFGVGRYTAVLRRSKDDVLTQPVTFEIAPGFQEGETVPITLTFNE